MPTTEFEKRKENLIRYISSGVTEEKELEALFKLFNKLMVRKAAKAKKNRKKTSTTVVPIPESPFYSRVRVPILTSLQSKSNVTHEEALQEIDKMIELWK